MTAGIIGIGMLGMLAAPAAHAGTSTWTGGGGGANNAWGSAANWSGGVPNKNAGVTDNDVVFAGGVGVTQLTSLLEFDYRLRSLTFNAGTAARAFTITEVGVDNQPHDWSLYIGAGGIVNNTALTQTVNGIVQLSSATTFNAATAGGTLSLLGTSANMYNHVDLNGSSPNSYGLTVTGPGNVSIASPIIGTGSGSTLTKTGTGTLTLSGANTYAGATTINGGTLSVAANTNLGGGSVILNGGLLRWTGGTQTFGRPVILGNAASGSGFEVTSAATTLAINSTLTGVGGLTKSGAGRLALNASNSYSGGTTITGGVLSISTLESLGTGAVTLNGGLLQWTGDWTAGDKTLPNTVILGPAATGSGFDIVNVTTVTVTSNLTGTGGLTKTGDGSLLLTGTNTYTGGTTILDGDVYLAQPGTTGASSLGSGSVTISKQGRLFVHGASSTGQALIENNATVIFRDSSTAGGATINVRGADSSVSFENTANAGNATITSDYGVFFGNSASAANATITNNATGVVAFFGGASAGSAVINNAGGLQFGQFASADNATVVNSAGGRIDLSYQEGPLSIGRLSGAGMVFVSGARLTVGGAVTDASVNDVISGVIQDGGGILGGSGGSLTKTGAGTLTLTGTNTYTGGTTINAGTLAVGNASALGSGAVTVNGGTLGASGAATTLSNAVTLGGYAGLSSGTVTTADARAAGLTLAGPVTLASDSAASNLDVTGASRVAIAGVIGEGSGPMVLVKSGAGTLELRGDNKYTGGTLVRAGTLVVNNALGRTALGSGTGEGAVTVASGATLTGTYRITGAVQVNGGGSLGVGNSIGQSRVGALTLSGGSVLSFEIGADGVSSDRLDVSSLLSRTGIGVITFDLSGEHLADGSVAGLSEGTFTLLTFGASNNLTVSDFFATGLGTDWTHAFSLTAPGTGGTSGIPGALTVTLARAGAPAAAPESSSLGLLVGAAVVGAAVMALPLVGSGTRWRSARRG